MNLSEAIKSIRKRRNETMVVFAEILGVCHSAISKYESAEINVGKPILKLLLQIAITDEEKAPIVAAINQPIPKAKPVPKCLRLHRLIQEIAAIFKANEFISPAAISNDLIKRVIEEADSAN